MLKKLLVAGIAATSFVGVASADGHQLVDNIDFLIPGGAGGGWDGTARGTGEALTGAGLVGSATYENMSGGGGGVAIGHLIENADSLHGTMMVNSTPIVIRSLQGVFPYNFRDLTMVAGVIGDYGAMVSHAGSSITSMDDLVAAYNADASSVAVGGGSVPGGMDHLIAAAVLNAAGADATQVAYLPYDAGGEAMAGLLSGEIEALSTGFGEAKALAEQGEVNILCVTSPAGATDYAACPAEFVNWRGFFASPTIPAETVDSYRAALAAMYDTPEWEAVRERNGWVNIFNEGDDFVSFLEDQEKVIGDLMTSLGFL
ncbi:MAG: tripartite tricarboxylate transporter substrate-binding protein [Alphaproteobacteria bacterium]